MFEVIGLKDYGTWLRKREKALCTDNHAIRMAKQGLLKITGYRVVNSGSRDFKKAIKKAKIESEAYKLKLETLKKYEAKQ